jgi:hypothetical protein
VCGVPYLKKRYRFISKNIETQVTVEGKQYLRKGEEKLSC